MTSLNWKQLIANAEEAGVTVKQLPAGKYPVAEATHVKVSTTQGGGERVGIRFKIVGGPEDGGSEWANINVPKEGDKPGASAAFLRNLTKLGVEPAGTFQEAFNVVIGRQYSIEVARTRPDKQGGFWTDVNILGPVAGLVPATAPAVAAVPPAPVESTLDDDEDFNERPV